MSLTKLYSSFMDSPRAEHIHDDAALHYITTLTSISSGPSISSHLGREAKLYKKKEQKVLSSVESGNSLVVEVATTLEFLNGGGSFLPGLDDNFITGQVITAPVVRVSSHHRSCLFANSYRFTWSILKTTRSSKFGYIGIKLASSSK